MCYIILGPFLPAAKTGLFAVPRLTRSILCFAKYAFGAATIPCPCGLAGESFILSKYLFIFIYCKSYKSIGSFIFSISFISSIFFRSTSLKTDSEKFGFTLYVMPCALQLASKYSLNSGFLKS